MAFKKNGLYLMLLIAYRLFSAIGMRWRGRTGEAFCCYGRILLSAIGGGGVSSLPGVVNCVFVAGIAFITVGLFVPYHFNYMSKTQEIYGIAAQEVTLLLPGGKDFFAGRGGGYGELWGYLQTGYFLFLLLWTI